MKRFKFILPFLPLVVGALALTFLPVLVQPEIVISFRLGLGAVLFLLGLLITVWIQALAVVDAVREKRRAQKLTLPSAITKRDIAASSAGWTMNSKIR